jgi:hypothetical protein
MIAASEATSVHCALPGFEILQGVISAVTSTWRATYVNRFVLSLSYKGNVAESVTFEGLTMSLSARVGDMHVISDRCPLR